MLTLEEMYNKIVNQQNMRGIIYQDLTEEQRKTYASACAHALHVEVAELASSWAFAPWKTTETDTENISREIIDCIFFLVNIAKSFNVTPKDLTVMFEWVLNNNKNRIMSGHHKEVKL